MEKYEIAPGIMVYKNVMPESLEIIKDIEEAVQSGAPIEWNSASQKSGDEVSTNKNIRDTDSIGVPYLGKVDENFLDIPDAFYKTLNNYFYTAFEPCEKDYMNHYGINFTNHDTYSVLKYGEGQHFVNHVDDHPSYLRRLSLVYYMNDDYEGGQINFPRFNIALKPEKNDLLFFPSTYVYNHSVSPVTSGVRYAVVNWVC